jgi:hypothetical protein
MEASMSDDMQTITEQAAKDARDVFESYGSKAREAIDYMEQLIYAATRKTERAIPAASSEDARAGALKEAAALVMQTHRPPSIVKDFRDGYDVAKADIAGAILALIPEAKP